MESIVVTTIAGSGELASKDGIGTAASVHAPGGICYLERGGTDGTPILLVTEVSACRIRSVNPFSVEKRARLDRALIAVLFDGGALPIAPIISMVYDYAIENSTVSIVPSVPRIMLYHDSELISFGAADSA